MPRSRPPLRRLLLAACRAALFTLGLALAGAPAANAASPGAAALLYIRGAGDGHGVGMSQYGAYGYALHGFGYQSILAHYYTGTALGPASPGQVVRVLLGTGRPSVTGADAAGSTALDPSSTYSVSPAPPGGLELSSPGHAPLGPFRAPLTLTGSGPLRVIGLGLYRGSLQFRPAGGGVQTVDVVGLEDYVRGVVSAEMPASWPAAALEAQAVAARTYALAAQVGGDGYDLYDDTRSQMYGGVSAETPATDAAVAATAGQIVTYDGRPAATYFFASSGGYTENVEDAWPGSSPEPWLRGVPDPYDSASIDPYYRWSARLGLATAAARLGGLVRGRLVGIRITRRGVSPRIVSAQVVGTGGTTAVSGDQLEADLGLDSTYADFTTIWISASRAGVLSGGVFPAPPGGSVALQMRSGGGAWRTVGRAALGRGGTWRVPAPGGPGSYRVSWRGLSGPVVNAR